MSVLPWWETHKGRLEFELAALDKAEILCTRDEDAFARGVLRLNLQVSIDGEALQLLAIFPDLYPYFRFEVKASELSLLHHQNPFGKNLCLLGRSTELWHTSDTLASFLVKRLPAVMQAGASCDTDEVADLEQHQAEPYADYYSYHTGPAVIVGGNWTIDSRHQSGTLQLGLMAPASRVLRGIVLEVRSEDNQILGQADERLHLAYSKWLASARWCRLADPPTRNSPQDIFNQLLESDPHPNRVEGYPVENGRLQVRAALYPDEIRSWRQAEHGWLFACRFESTESWRRSRKGRRNKGR